MNRFFNALLALMLVAGLFLPTGNVQAATNNFTVTPLSTDWGFLQETAGTFTGSFVSGPGTPPAGQGSVRLTVDSTAGGIFGAQKYAGTRLADFEVLSYSTYVTVGSGFTAPTFQFNYDPDVTSTEATWYGRLVYEPYQNGTVLTASWQTWDMLAGEWWASSNTNSPVDDTCGQSTPCTLATLLATWPNIGIRAENTGIMFKAGSGWSDGFDGNIDNLTISISGGDTDIYDFEPLTTVYVDDDWVGTTPGDDPDGAGPATSFGLDAFDVIQDGLNAVANNGTVHVYAGTYIEELVIDKPLTLLGPNDAINPNTGSRVTEAIIHPVNIGTYPAPDTNADCTVLVYLEASDVTLRGFNFDGDNPSLTSGISIDTADVDTCEVIASYEGVGNIVVENNIIKNSIYSGVDFYNYYNSGSATSSNYIRYNRIENIGTTYGYGPGVLVYNNFYVDITDNVFENVRVGIQTGNYYQANPGSTGRITDNTINAWRTGIFHNLWYSNASNIPVSGNTINAISSNGATNWNGMLISSWQNTANTTIVDNVINIGTITQSPAAGYNIWNTPTSADLTISGGTVTGGTHGVFVNNFDGYSSNANNTSIIVDGVTISDAAEAGVYVKDNPSNTNSAIVFANIQNSIITNSGTGVLVEGADASAQANFNQIYGNTTGVNNTSGNMMNAENNWWGSNNGPEDTAGTVELPFDPEPIVEDFLNAEPGGALGDVVSDDVDYYPWDDTYVPPNQTTTFYSQAKRDGWILESTETSGLGGTKNNASSTLLLGDDASDRQYRSILSFNTAAIPDGATITSVSLYLKQHSYTGGSNIITKFKGIMVDVKKGNLGRASLQLGDFNRTATQTVGPFFPILSNNWFGWYEIDLTAAANSINKTGNTQLRLRFKLGDNDNSAANLLRLFSGNAATDSRPQLIIEYTVPNP